ncbi:hypothetical protein FRC03_012327 [Tulasnella sp. 419]|nr:hypothetical protein FRC03_012327 [Tulasnella sp. 419]
MAHRPFLSQDGKPYGRTIIRLPLRTVEEATKSKIKPRAVTTQQIQSWFEDFIDSELRLGMLFLKHITVIEIKEVGADGIIDIARVEIQNIDQQLNDKRSRDRGRSVDQEQQDYIIELRIVAHGRAQTVPWKIVHFVGAYDQVVADLSDKFPDSPDSVCQLMTNDKLLPHVAIAVPLEHGSILSCRGRLFTLLPLPIITGFPLHIHSVFALTTDRQTLRNAQEKLDYGSRESFLVFWNRYIFDILLPKAWSHLLHVLVHQQIEFFPALPLSAPNTAEVQSYWASVPRKLLQEIDSAKLWATSRGLEALQSVMLAHNVDHEVVDILVIAGLSISMVPENVIQWMASSVEYQAAILSPQTVSTYLKDSGRNLEGLTSEQLDRLCEYIASADDINLFQDIRLIPDAVGKRMSLSSFDRVTFVNKEETRLFAFDGSGWIGLDSMPQLTKHLFHRCKGLAALNDDDIITFMQANWINDANSPSSISAPGRIDWICRFWDYVSSYSWKKSLLHRLEDYHLLPDQQENIWKLSSGICDYEGVDVALKVALEKGGVPLVHTSMSLDAKNILRNSGKLQFVSNIPFLLPKIKLFVSAFSNPDRCRLHRHFETYISSHQLCDNEERTILNLPIFPCFEAGSRKQLVELQSFVPFSNSSYLVESDVEVIPQISQVYFIDATQCRNIIIALKGVIITNETDVLKLVLEQQIWDRQSGQVRDALIDRIASRYTDLINHEGVREKIRTLPFIHVGGGNHRPPCEVVDPHAEIADLFTKEDQMLPAPPYNPILGILRQHSVLIQYLTPEIIEDRINNIRRIRPLELLKLIDRHFLMSEEGRIAALEIPSESALFSASWLFSPGSIKINQCMDIHPRISKFLYDLALPLVEYTVRSNNLRNLLGWDQISTSVLFAQFREALRSTEEGYWRLKELIPEIASQRIQEIETTALSHHPRSIAYIKAVIELLAQLVELSDESLDDNDRKTLRMPIAPLTDEGGNAVLFAEMDDVYFDNTERAVNTGAEDACFAHSAISKELAEKLGLKRWSDRQFDGDTATFIYRDYGEDFIRRIRHVLERGYRRHVSLNEWVANAIDAGAASVSVYVNTFTPHIASTAAPSPSLAKFFSGPSLVVHNSGSFAKADFEGLLNVGLGGKTRKPHAIGRFGLGVLSFYHFGDVIMVISRGTVMFLDPSGEHLPRRWSSHSDGKVTALEIKLLDCYIKFPDIFIALEGLEGFQPSLGNYDGTLFWVPLRTTDQAGSSKTISKPCTVEDLEADFEGFFEIAEKSFFFSGIRVIEAFRRNSFSDVLPIWSVRCEEVAEDTTYDGHTSRRLRLETTKHSDLARSEWFVLLQSHPLPSEYHQIAGVHRLPESLSTGIAISLHHNPPSHHSLFACLPLPIDTQLPFHVNAPWILSEDRRKLQLDDKSSSEGDFNRWLLQDIIPLLYLQAIALLSGNTKTRVIGQSLWPSKLKSGYGPDQYIIQGLRTHFASSDQLVCPVKGEVMVQPNKAIFAVNGNKSVYELLALRPDFIRVLPFDEDSSDIWAGQTKVSTSVVRNTLLEATPAILSDHSSIINDRISLEEVILYLQGSQTLAGLPLLLLANLSLVCFGDYGDRSVFEFNEDLSALFGAENFLARGILKDETIDLLAKSRTVNLKRVDTEAVKELMYEGRFKLLPSNDLIPADFDDARSWLEDFWSRFDWMQRSGVHGGLKEFRSLPLIPVVGGKLVSIEACGKGETFWRSAGEEDSEIVEALVDCGVKVISLNSQPALNELEVSSKLSIDPVLRSLTALESSHDISSIALSNSWPSLARWIKRTGFYKGSNILDEFPIIGRLPLWESYQYSPRFELSMKPSTEVTLFPPHIDPSSTQHYFRATYNEWYTAYDHFLNDLMERANYSNALSKSEFVGRLRMPTSISAMEVSSYFRFLGALLNSIESPLLKDKAIVPNTSGYLCIAGSLFDNETPLFDIAFSEQPDCFVHPDFRSMIPEFLDIGLNNTVTAENFLKAVVAVDESTREGLEVDNDGVAFAHLNREPWIFNIEERKDAWARLRKLRFVRQNPGTRCTVPQLARLGRRLASVLALDQLVCNEYRSISWTQRACFLEEASADLRTVFVGIGEPTIAEVVQHLITITNAASSSTTNAHHLIDDIKETYAWLEDHSADAEAYLKPHQEKPIFLNVDLAELSSGTYHWHSPRSIWLDLRWDNGKDYPVREYLQPFQKLLVAAGVRSFSTGVLASPLTGVDGDSSRMRQRFDYFRGLDKFTDMALISKNGDQLKAHRLVLAASSDFFSELLTGDYSEGRAPTSEEQPMHLELPFSTTELKIVLDYVYTGHFQLPSVEDADQAMEALDVLLNVLDISNQWSFPILKYQASKAIVDLEIIQPMNIDAVIERAREAEANELLEKCKKDRENMS